MGQFKTNNLSENGHRFPIIGQISINGSVLILGIPDFFRNSGLSFIENLQALTVLYGWGDDNTSNKNWGVSPGETYNNTRVSWGSTIPSHPAYMPMSQENLCAAAISVCDEFHLS